MSVWPKESYALMNSKTNKKLIESYNIQDIADYLEENFYLRKAFVAHSRVYILLKYMEIRGYNVLCCREYDEPIMAKRGDESDLSTLEIKTFKNYQDLCDWLVHKPDFSLKYLTPYICPHCDDLDITINSEKNAMIYICNRCKHQIVEIL